MNVPVYNYRTVLIFFIGIDFAINSKSEILYPSDEKSNTYTSCSIITSTVHHVKILKAQYLINENDSKSQVISEFV